MSQTQKCDTSVGWFSGARCCLSDKRDGWSGIPRVQGLPSPAQSPFLTAKTHERPDTRCGRERLVPSLAPWLLRNWIRVDVCYLTKGPNDMVSKREQGVPDLASLPRPSCAETPKNSLVHRTSLDDNALRKDRPQRDLEQKSRLSLDWWAPCKEL